MKTSDETYSEAETKRRMEAGLRRALSTPHKPNEKFKGKNAVTGLRKRKTSPKKRAIAK